MLGFLEAGLERILFVLLKLGLLLHCLAEKVAVFELLPVVVGLINLFPLPCQVILGHVNNVLVFCSSFFLCSLGGLLFLHFQAATLFDHGAPWVRNSFNHSWLHHHICWLSFFLVRCLSSSVLLFLLFFQRRGFFLLPLQSTLARLDACKSLVKAKSLPGRL